MRNVLFSIFAFIFVAAATPSRATGIDMDVVCYYGNDTLTFCELLVGIQRSSILYSAVDGDSVSAAFTIITSLSQNDTTFLSDTVDTKDRRLRDSTSSSGAFFPYVFRYLLSPGDYDVLIEIEQENVEVSRTSDTRIHIPSIGDSATISDVALGAELEFDAQPSRYTKNGVRFVPNPSKFYGSGMPMLYYYAELYGLKGDSASAESLTVTRSVIASESNKIAKQPSSRKYAMTSSSMVIADGFPAYTLRTGTYDLLIAVEAPGQPERKVSKKFWVYRNEDLADGRDFAMDSDIATQIFSSDQDIVMTIDPDSGLVLMQHLLTQKDMRRARDMDPEGKRLFMLDYWSRQHPGDPDAANRHFARVAEANRRYSFLNREGWKTDRGRVLIIYGEPDYVDRRYADAAGLDHEIWYYDKLEGGVLFVFVDKSGFGDLDLVHSTKRGEIYNPNALYTEQNQNPSSKTIDQTRGLRD
jgi:GWxTD domain-containing protein